MPLFKTLPDETVIQIKPKTLPKERDLQKLFETNLETFLGVRYIASEFFTGDRQRGRIDTLGLDQDNYPTIIEYKRSNKDNIINQGLFYLDWLVDHKGDFALAAQEAIGPHVVIDWSHPRLILIAESFSDYDKYAVNRIGANIELWTYRKYGDDLFYLNPLFVASPVASKRAIKLTTKGIDPDTTPEEKTEIPVYTLEDHTKRKPERIIELFESLRERIIELAEVGDITEKFNKMYIGYKHGKNFCEIKLQSNGLKIWLDIPYSDLDDPFDHAKDVSNIGHHGTGQVETRLTSEDDIDKVLYLIDQSYKQSI
jgi:predicted transport protein